MIRIVCYSLLLAVFTLSGCAHVRELPRVSRGDYESVRKYLSKYIPEQMEKYDVPGVSIALVDDQKIVWAQGFGYADKERGIPATAETVYRLGSITKTFTATAAMKLVEEGRLDLDRPLRSYLTDFSMKRLTADKSPVTPRALLSHHAGLPRYFVKGMLSEKPHSVLLDGLKDDYILYPIGSRFDYSNVGYALMGDVIERTSGKAYASFLRDGFLRPLHMDHSAFTVNENVAPFMAKGYAHGKPMPEISFRDLAPSAMVSNVTDLSKFIQLVFADGESGGKRLIRKKTLHRMFERQYPDAKLDFGISFGLGWFLGGIHGLEKYSVAWHEGRTTSSWNKLIMLRDKKLGVVVLTNSADGRLLAKNAAETAIKLLLQARYGDNDITGLPVTDARLNRKSLAEDLTEYAGNYSFMGTLAQVYMDGEKLKVKVSGHIMDAVPLGAGVFRFEKKILGLFPVKLGLLKITRVNGNDYIITFEKGALSGERIPKHEIPEQWKKRVGDYRLINPDDEPVVRFKHVRLIIEDGFLQLDVDSDRPEAQGKMVLVPVSDKAARVFGAGSTGGINGTFIGRRLNGKEQLWFSGYIFEKVRPEDRIQD